MLHSKVSFVVYRTKCMFVRIFFCCYIMNSDYSDDCKLKQNFDVKNGKIFAPYGNIIKMFRSVCVLLQFLRMHQNAFD